MHYGAPLEDILFQLRVAAGPDAFSASGLYADLAGGIVEQTLAEAAHFAQTALLPLDRIGDRIGVIYADGAVTTAPGWRAAYAQWRAGGWNALAADPQYGGLGLPTLLNMGCTEIWNAANMAFALCPLLGQGAIEAIAAHADAALKALYLPRIVSGEWTATMNLTEPQAGSDLALLRTRAEPADDGAYRIFGQKIYITYGEHDLADNIVHLVLARLPDAPAGTRGISLFLVPKFLPDATGAFTQRNDLRCAGVERKLGVHGAPTCTMIFGDSAGATGYLVGAPHDGLACMFTMMNNARLAVGLQGVAMSARATQLACAYAQERRQGRVAGMEGPGPIIRHPDVARMLLTMASGTAAARAICYETAVAIDHARRDGDPRAAAQASARAGLLTPVAKAFSTDIANETTSLGVQVFGGMGYIEETGAAQLMRDARICAIYEGTNGIQAIDLVTRKLPRGESFAREMVDMWAEAQTSPNHATGVAVDALAEASAFLTNAHATDTGAALAGATPFLRLFALARGATLLDRTARAAEKDDNRAIADRWRVLARFFAENIATAAPGLARMVIDGATPLKEAEKVLDF